MDEWREQGYYPKQKASGEIVHVPYSFVEDADKAEVLELVRNLSQPKLIIIGNADEVVDPSETKEIYDHAAEPKELIELEGVGHLYKKSREQVAEVNKNVIAFFEENL
jgi:esterase/lipase